MRALFLLITLFFAGTSPLSAEIGLKGDGRHSFGLICDTPRQVALFYNLKAQYGEKDEAILKRVDSASGYTSSCLLTEILFTTEDQLIQAKTTKGEVDVLVVLVHLYLTPSGWEPWAKTCYFTPRAKPLKGFEI